ncbi:unnamed protein product [Coffea canephora]|uniref:DC1 domain-containing protein n=2 Tax=Coffea TaxID=13442 RepID=A0A068UPD3_COFCA|nr:uncharacterized protein LOC113692027 [Coffea arabica]XP_027176828.1 uncharacterized protein LOC113775964 [Coffea eugenioides]CDP10152.1 unnamed protein product [Coffea canephora]
MEYKHFSHQHNLNIYKVQQGQICRCHGCQSLCHDSIYACWACDFFLHEHCGNATRYVNHPAHPLHPLILIPSPTYCSGSFVCNACGEIGNAFSYCCALCEIDLHLNCAFMPPKVSHKAHQHELVVSVGSPDRKGAPEFCKICTKELNSKNWSYCCLKPECDFRVHTFCATSEVKPGLYQGDDPDSEIPEPNSAATEANGNQPKPAPPKPSDPAAELLELQLQMQMAQQLAQMMASFNLSQFV